MPGGGSIVGAFSGGFGGVFVNLGLSIVLGALSGALGSRPRAPEPVGFQAQRRGRQLTIRESDRAHTIVYGRDRVGSTLRLAEVTGSDNEFIHLVCVHCLGPVEEFVETYFDDTLATDERFDNHAELTSHLGALDQTADADLVADVANWTSSHRGRGIAYTRARLKWDQDVWLGNLPAISAVIKGRKVYDPRVSSHVVDDSGTWEWSENPALCIADFLRADYGFQADAADIDWDSFAAAADDCDDSIPVGAGGSQKRYTCNGSFELDRAPIEILEDLLTSCAGRIGVHGGVFRLFPGVAPSNSFSLTEDDLAGELEIIPAPARGEIFNALRGTYHDAEKFDKRVDFPPVTSALHEAEDGGKRLWSDIDLPFTDNVLRAQRIATIELRRARQGMLVRFPCQWKTGLALTVMDTGTLSIDVGSTAVFSNKQFTVISIERGEGPWFDLVLQEEAAATYDWSTDLEQVLDPAPNTSLPDPFSLPAVTGLAVQSGDTLTEIAGDGTALPGLLVSWTRPASVRVVEYEVQWRRSAAAPSSDEYDHAVLVGPERSSVLLQGGIKDGDDYDVRIRYRTALGPRSGWATLLDHAAGGKTSSNAAPTGFAADGVAQGLFLTWDDPAAADHRHMEVWTSAVNDRATAAKVGEVAGTAFAINNMTTGQTLYSWIRAVDRSGNVSDWSSGATAGTAATALAADAIVNQGNFATVDQIDGSNVTTLIANAVIGTAQIDEVAASKIVAGTIGAEVIEVGASTLALDGTNRWILVKDTQGSPVNRVKLGKLGAGAADYGMEIRDASGNLIIDADGLGLDVVGTANIDDLAVDTIKIADAAVNVVSSGFDASEQTSSSTSTYGLLLEISHAGEGGVALVSISCQLHKTATHPTADTCLLRLRRTTGGAKTYFEDVRVAVPADTTPDSLVPFNFTANVDMVSGTNTFRFEGHPDTVSQPITAANVSILILEPQK